MKGAFVCIPVLLVATMTAGCKDLSSPFRNTPGQVVKAFYQAANVGKYSEAEQLLAEDADKAMKGDLGQMAGGFKHICDKSTKGGIILRVDIVKEDVRGEGATVVADIAYKDGSSQKGDKTELIKEKGSWKITLGN